MPTPRIDKLAVDFIHKIPDEFETAFIPGSGAMPDGKVLDAEKIMDFLNRAMMQLFNEKWNEAFGFAKGNTSQAIKTFTGILPELVKFSGELEGSADLTGIAYPIANPHLDFFRIIGAIGKDDQYIKVWDESKFTLAISGEYGEYTATEEDPAIIQMHKVLFIFPSSLTDFTFRIIYIGLPIDPETGLPLAQNGDYDSPFFEHWNEEIINKAFDLYLIESQQTG